MDTLLTKEELTPMTAEEIAEAERLFEEQWSKITEDDLKDLPF